MTTLKTRCIDNEGSRYTAAPIPPLPALISPLTGPRTPPLSPRIRGRSAFQSHRAECASLGKRKKLSPEMPPAVAKGPGYLQDIGEFTLQIFSCVLLPLTSLSWSFARSATRQY